MKIKNSYKWIMIVMPIFMLSGCYHLQWKSNANHQIGKNINDPKLKVVFAGNLEQAKNRGALYKEVPEPPNIRYYFDWKYQNRCQYSLLVAPDGTILSWEFVDYKKRKECYVY